MNQPNTHPIQDGSKSEKKPYSRPELTNHGKVEHLTQAIIYPGTSQPIPG